MKKLSSVLFALPVLAWSASSQAIPASYGTISHDTTKWQELDSMNGDTYGVSWSVDNGATWGRDDLFVGQTVQFRVDMHKKNVGTHYADLSSVWVDWGMDGAFDHDADQVIFGEHVLAPQKGVVNELVESQLGSDEAPDTPNFSFFSSDYLLTSANVGETWLRATGTCSHSVTKAFKQNGGDLGGYRSWDAQWQWDSAQYQANYLPTGHYYQGEFEEWKITVSQVSEPSSLLLMGLGLAGLVATRRKQK